MSNTITALICTNEVSTGVTLASGLKEKGIRAYARNGTESSLIHSIINDKPDIVVTDLTLFDTDAVSLMKNASVLLSETPGFIVLSEIDNNFIKRQIIECGASQILIHPVNVSELYETVRDAAVKHVSTFCIDTEILVTELMHKAGVPPHIRGYRYIRTGVLECLRDKTLLDSITKRLYPIIAERYNTTSTRVERSIRHAIGAAWNRGKPEDICSCLGYSSATFSMRPTNSEFLAMMVDRIMLRLHTASVGYERLALQSPVKSEISNAAENFFKR